MQTSAYFHQLIIHGSSDWSLTAGSTVSFSRFFLFFFTWGAEFFFFIHSFPLNNCSDRQRCHNGWNGVSRWHKNGRRDVTRRPSKDTHSRQKNIARPWDDGSHLFTSENGQKNKCRSKMFYSLHTPPIREGRNFGPKAKKKCPHPFKMGLKQIWTYRSIALEILYLRSFECNLISARGRPQICVKGAGVSVVVCLLLVFNWLAAEMLIVSSWTQKTFESSF